MKTDKRYVSDFKTSMDEGTLTSDDQITIK